MQVCITNNINFFVGLRTSAQRILPQSYRPPLLRFRDTIDQYWHNLIFGRSVIITPIRYHLCAVGQRHTNRTIRAVILLSKIGDK